MKIFDESEPITKKLDFIENGISKCNDVDQSIIEVKEEKETDDCSIEENSDDNE